MINYRVVYGAGQGSAWECRGCVFPGEVVQLEGLLKAEYAAVDFGGSHPHGKVSVVRHC